jgi:hypothetical protein
MPAIAPKQQPRRLNNHQERSWQNHGIGPESPADFTTDPE